MNKFNSNWCIFVIFVTQITSFVPFGIHLTILNPSAPAIKAFANEAFMIRYNSSASEHSLQVIIATSQSIILVGTAVGCILVHIILTNFSRKTNLLLAHCNLIFAAVLMSPVAKLSLSYESIIIGRFVNGVSRGIIFTLVPLYIAEVVNRQTLASYQAFNGAFLHIGSSLGNALAHPAMLGDSNTWPYLLAAPAMFSMFYLIFIPWLPHSPSYLLLNQSQTDRISNGQAEKTEAFLTLKCLRIGSKTNVAQEYRQLCQELVDDSMIQKATFREVFFNKRFRFQLTGTIFVQLAAQFAGLQVVLQYTNKVFEATGVNANEATLYTIGLFLVLALSCFLASPLLQRFGSKTLLFSGIFIIVCSLCLLTVLTFAKNPNLILLDVVSLFFYFIGSGFGPMMALFALPSEITTVQSRPVILWISGIVFWLVATVTAFSAPFLLDSLGGYIYLIFIGFSLLDAAYIWRFIPDTHKKTVTEIQLMLHEQTSQFDSGTTFVVDNIHSASTM